MKYHQFVPDPERIAARIAGHDAVSATPRSEAAPVRDGKNAEPLPATLERLTALRDRAFVEAAYQVLLGREADPEGCEHLLGGLRSGAIDKVDVLGNLRYSSEGERQSVHIAGLAWRYRLRRIGHVPLIGWLTRSLEGALRLPTILRVAQRQQAAIEHASVEAEEHAAAIQLLQRELHEMRGLVSRVSTAERALGELMGEVRLLSRSFAGSVSAVEHSFETRHQRLTAALAEVRRQLEAMPVGAPQLLRDPETPSARNPPTQRPNPSEGFLPSASAEATADKSSDFDAFYLEFEDRFRGSRGDTKRAQEVYLDYVRTAEAGTAAAPIVDLGCGRGEWLELLRERGLHATGVDHNRVMLAENKDRGLEVVEADALVYLSGLPDDSVGMVTSFHMIEHMPFERLVRLLDECRRVLRPGGCAVFETPNPENLVVSGYTFHLDPTHLRPLPPAMTEFLAWQRGFAAVELLRLHPRPEHGSDEALLDRWFRGPTDYALIGWKNHKGRLSNSADAHPDR